MPSINLATKYSSVLDQLFTHDSYTERYVNNKYSFAGAKTVEVYTVTTVAPSNYDRTSTGDRFGGNNELQDTVKAYSIANDKGFKIVIDRGNYEQQALAKKAGEVMKAEMNEQVIPMIDANRLKVAHAGAEAISQIVTSTANAYTDFLTANAYLDEAQAPAEGRVAFVTPGFYNAIKSKIVTFMTPGINDKALGKGVVGELDGVTIVKVPSKLMPTAGSDCIMWHKDAILGVKQINSTRIITDSELVDGQVLVGRFVFDTFVLDGKKKAVAAISKSGS